MRMKDWVNESGLILFEEQIIQEWLKQMTRLYTYHAEDLYVEGKLYFQFIKDYHIAFKEHELFDSIKQRCYDYVNNQKPIEQILHSLQLWREIIADSICHGPYASGLSREQMYSIVTEVHRRIDESIQVVTAVYFDYAINLVKQKEEMIVQLRGDRLALLGEMGASMAHEIRNPLTAIEGFLKLIRAALSSEEKPNAKLLSYMDIIENEFEGLYTQVNGFLSFSKKDKTEEPMVPCQSSEIIRSVVSLINPQCINAKIKLKIRLESERELVVQKRSMQQVLTNLIQNSIDALSEREKTRVIKIRTYEDGMKFYFSVEDNGAGIPEHIKNDVFEPFVTSKATGTGLGLAVCKQLVEKNNGEIHMHSEPGKTAFIISFAK